MSSSFILKHFRRIGTCAFNQFWFTCCFYWCCFPLFFCSLMPIRSEIMGALLLPVWVFGVVFSPKMYRPLGSNSNRLPFTVDWRYLFGIILEEVSVSTHSRWHPWCQEFCLSFSFLFMRTSAIQFICAHFSLASFVVDLCFNKGTKQMRTTILEFEAVHGYTGSRTQQSRKWRTKGRNKQIGGGGT